MIKRQNFLLCLFLLPALIFVSVFVSCDSFFSESWGSERSYDPDKIDLTTSNLDSWIENSIGNPKLAAALTEKIKVKVASMGNGSERAKFQEAGVELAIEASGIGTSIVSNAADILGNIDDLDGDQAVKDILKDIQSDFSSGGPQAAANLAEIVNVSVDPSSTGNGSVPKFNSDDSYAATAAASDVGEAVLVLSLAVLGDDIAKGVEDLGDGTDVAGLQLVNNKIKVTGNASSEAIALAAYLNLIVDDTTGKFDNNPVTSAIKEAFKLDD
ncbi:MAG: hypothetical protein LBL43_06595 [Treponema sp.]|nr:hypothetical protein [Treponema sp.]